MAWARLMEQEEEFQQPLFLLYHRPVMKLLLLPKVLEVLGELLSLLILSLVKLFEQWEVEIQLQ